jgi:5-methylcytosine-specific restriction endonuclease McrA
MARCLLLNASYEPHSIISDRDAVCMYLDDVIEAVVYSGEVMRSPSITVMVPSVARLIRYVPMPEHMRSVMLTRKAVCARDHYVCAYCLGEADTMDHVQPRAKGGRHVWENVVASCHRCNHRKGNKTLEQLGWKMHNTPYRPQGIGARILALQPDPAWEPYLAMV